MSDKAALLQTLKIEREAPAPRGRGFAAGWIVLASVVLVATATATYYAMQPERVVVRAVPVEAMTADASTPAGAPLLEASGYVVARRQATVAAKITDRVTEVLIEEGQRVEAGQVIARLDDTNTGAALDQARAQKAQAEASLASARLAYTDARPIFLRLEKLAGLGWSSRADLDVARQTYDTAASSLKVAEQAVVVADAGLAVAQRNQDDTVVRAPYAGVVTVKAAQPGEVVSPISAGGGFTRTGIGTIVDMNSLEVEVDVNESFIHRVHADQNATVRLNAYPDWAIPATVIAVIPTADRSKATVKVRVGFKQRDQRILPEMGARVAFLSDAPPEAAANAARQPAKTAGVSVPAEAIEGAGDAGTAFVVTGDHVEARAVKLGARSEGRQTVLQGLTAGEEVAIGDFSKLADGCKVQVDSTGGS